MAIEIKAPCLKCSVFTEEDRTMQAVFATGELSNDWYSMLRCPNGHSIKYYSLAPDYPLYFDHAIDALDGGNYFEAFTSVYHAWEQFETSAIYAFFTAQLVSGGMAATPEQVHKKVDELVRPLISTSENADKVYKALFAERFREPAPKLSDKFVKLRNSIVHGRRNPEKEDVKKFILRIYNCIKPVEPLLMTSDSERILLGASPSNHPFVLDSWIFLSVAAGKRYRAEQEKASNSNADGELTESMGNLVTVLGSELDHQPQSLKESLSLIQAATDVETIIEKRHKLRHELEKADPFMQSKSQ